METTFFPDLSSRFAVQTARPGPSALWRSCCCCRRRLRLPVPSLRRDDERRKQILSSTRRPGRTTKTRGRRAPAFRPEHGKIHCVYASPVPSRAALGRDDDGKSARNGHMKVAVWQSGFRAAVPSAIFPFIGDDLAVIRQSPRRDNLNVAFQARDICQGHGHPF